MSGTWDVLLTNFHPTPSPVFPPRHVVGRPTCASGLIKLEGDVTQLKLQRAQQDAAVKARERDVERLNKALEALKLELHEAGVK